MVKFRIFIVIYFTIIQSVHIKRRIQAQVRVPGWIREDPQQGCKSTVHCFHANKAVSILPDR
jgi:hypothetical protein